MFRAVVQRDEHAETLDRRDRTGQDLAGLKALEEHPEFPVRGGRRRQENLALGGVNGDHLGSDPLPDLHTLTRESKPWTIQRPHHPQRARGEAVQGHRQPRPIDLHNRPPAEIAHTNRRQKPPDSLVGRHFPHAVQALTRSSR